MLFMVAHLYSQDFIYKQDGTQIESVVVEITDTHIKYKLYNQQDGPLRNIIKTDIIQIIYKDGTKETFNYDIKKLEEQHITRRKALPNSETKLAYNTGTIVFKSEENGFLWFDDQLISDLPKGYKIKIQGIAPGLHKVKFNHDTNSIVKEIEIEPNDYLTYHIDKQTFIIIERRTEYGQTEIGITVKPKYIPKQNGFYNLTRCGAGFEPDTRNAVLNFSTIVGYKFNPFVSLGLGIGFEALGVGAMGINPKFIQIFANTKINFTKAKISPLLMVNAGVNIGFNETDWARDYSTNKSYTNYKLKSGIIYIGIGPGLTMTLSKNLYIFLAMEVSYQPFSSTKQGQNEEVHYTSVPIIFSLGLGF